MKKFLLFAAFQFVLIVTSFAQQFVIEGKVTDKRDNEALAGIVVTLLPDNIKSVTNVSGYYKFTVTEKKTYSIVVKYKTDEKVISDINVTEKITYQDIALEPKAKVNEEVVVTAQKSGGRKESAVAMIAVQKNSAAVAQVISAELIRRSPDKHTGDVLKRVTGTSVQEGKYLIVRGLSDRYNMAMLNGVQLGSTEPDRKTFSFDIFPAAMIDNIVMNKTFLPELPAEWAGGLVQVQTKDAPATNFTTIQINTGFNSQTIGNPFLQTAGSNLDFLGIDNKTRALPNNLPTKSTFSSLSATDKNKMGTLFRNNWTALQTKAPLNTGLQLTSGFNSKLFGKKLGGILAITYSQSNKTMPFENRVIANDNGDVELFYNNNRYSREVLAGALANFTLQLNNKNKISFKNIINVNSNDFITDRYDGRDYILSGGGQGDRVKATEIGFKQNTFFTSQMVGESNFTKSNMKLKYYGSFSILDQYIPDQRRLFYTQETAIPNAPFIALLGLGAGQKSGSIFYSFLNDYIYNAGGDLSKSFEVNGKKQTIKGGYLFQVKDRIFDSRPFFFNTASNAIKLLSADKIFAANNFGDGNDKVQIGELTGNPYRYIANTILNAGYLQIDNAISSKLRIVWGARLEHFDQLIGSVKKSDERHINSKILDILPGVNITLTPNVKTNIRVSASQTLVRPEFRELSPFAFYDFELNAQVIGNPNAKRTKVTNLDLRYEIYPNPGELFTAGVFYKKFQNPIEYYFNRTGPASNSFNVANTKQANNYGVEIEGRKKMNGSLKNFTVSGNVTLIKSRVTDDVALDRPLQGQSPYLVNLGLQYDVPKLDLNSTILFNQSGRRIFFVGDANDQGIPAIWEAPRPLLDFQIAKKILKKKAEFKLNINDLFNTPANFYHDLDNSGKYGNNSKDVLSIRRRLGTNFSLSFTYNIK